MSPRASPGPSRPLSREAVLSGSDRQIGLAKATRRENRIQAHNEVQLDQAFSISHPAGPLRVLDPLGGGDPAEVLGLIRPEEFLQETQNLDHKIEEVSRSVRLEHLSEPKLQDKERQLRDEVRKQREAELRRARLQEQEARNPQRKVALKLENKRRFETHTAAEDKHIPMMRVEVEPHSSVSLVDVRTLQSRCKWLDDNAPSVRDMLEMEKRKEKEEMSRCLRSHASVPEMSSLAEVSYEDRLQRARLKNKRQQAEKILRKLAHCRDPPPYMLPFRLKSVQARQAIRVTPDLGSPVGSDLSSRGSVSPTGLEVPPSPRAGSRRASIFNRRKSMAWDPRRKGMVGDSPKSSVAKLRAARMRLRRRWALVRAAVRWLILFIQKMRLYRVEIIKSILRQLGEWARMKRSVRRLVGAIRGVQKTVRRFLEHKRRCCEQMQREWIKLEEVQLGEYFKSYTQKMIKEMKAQAKGMEMPAPRSTAKRGTRRSMSNGSSANLRKGDFIHIIEAGVDSGNLAIDWRSYRIPAKDRWAIITFYYRSRLRRHVRSQSMLLQSVKARLDNEKEMVNFLECFGANEATVKDFRRSVFKEEQASTPLPFWHLSEETILQLIALAAQSYVGKKPFQDHPANKDVPPETYRSRITISFDSDEVHEGSASSVRAAALIRRLDRPDVTKSLGRLRRHQPMRTSRPPVQASHAMPRRSLSRGGLEDVFRGFSPRKWDTADDTTQHTKWGPQDDTESLISA